MTRATPKTSSAATITPTTDQRTLVGQARTRQDIHWTHSTWHYPPALLDAVRDVINRSQ